MSKKRQNEKVRSEMAPMMLSKVQWKFISETFTNFGYIFLATNFFTKIFGADVKLLEMIFVFLITFSFIFMGFVFLPEEE